MGGDYAPREIVRGGVQAARELDIDLVLVGARERIEAELIEKAPAVEIVDTPDRIAFTEQPAFALKTKPRASIALVNQLVHDGQADAAVTMGHTGAGMISSQTHLAGPFDVPESPAEGDLDYRTHFERRTRLGGGRVYRALFRKPPTA